ncbi:MAG: bifunctional folylpolyglutamate synthase/dihydrofolate synthase [Gemmatimonadaceae bacterium]|nr:bifunctional folylpolyglutamate synthase/dihydrofolate synthase [Gemmatimonadaceae bacterium]
MGVHLSGRAGARRYDEALAYLFARTTGGVRPGLERTSALLGRLGDPHRRVRMLHIAGTNGKGSTVATASAVLRARGLRVGTYTSPHLVDFRERIVVDGAPIPVDAVTSFVERWTDDVERLGATFFEATTALAFDWFAQSRVDIALVETGLGGRLDATNVITPLAAGVATIGLDHMEILGDSIEAIAAEKAGIFKRGVPAVIGDTDPRVQRLLALDAERAGASRIVVAAESYRVHDVSVGAATGFTLELPSGRQRLQTPLVGRHQAFNTAFAVALLDAAGAPFASEPATLAAALETVRLPGRFDRRGRYLFDVAHNDDGARVLVEALGAAVVHRPLAAVVCVLSDKAWRPMLARLAGVVDHLVLTEAPSAPPDRRWPLDEAVRHARELGAKVEGVAALDAALARAAGLGETVLVTGSFHTVGDAMRCLQLDPLAG